MQSCIAFRIAPNPSYFLCIWPVLCLVRACLKHSKVVDPLLVEEEKWPNRTDSFDLQIAAHAAAASTPLFLDSWQGESINGSGHREKGAQKRTHHAPHCEQQRARITLLAIQHLSVSSGNDNRLKIDEKSPKPIGKETQIQKKTKIDNLSSIIDANRTIYRFAY